MILFLTAETIRIITGVDVGYDMEFIKGYRTNDEIKRQKMIQEWEKLILNPAQSDAMGAQR